MIIGNFIDFIIDFNLSSLHDYTLVFLLCKRRMWPCFDTLISLKGVRDFSD